MEDSGSPWTLLMCRESIETLDEEEDQMGAVINPIVEELYENDEYIETILYGEALSNGHFSVESFINISSVQQARLDGIHYILRKREHLGFRFQTAYVSVTYLDRFLSKGTINLEKSWVVRLLSMACLSLAAKMIEIKVTPLPSFCFPEEYSFESKSIQRMELLVLNTLDWKMGTITPFCFIHFFAKKFFENFQSTTALSRTMEVVLSSTRDLKIMNYRPSIIAAAATLVVINQGLSRESLEQKLGSLSSSLKIEDVLSCHFLVVEEMNKERTQNHHSLRATPPPNGSYSAGGSSKRKRLVFDDQNGHVSEKMKLQFD